MTPDRWQRIEETLSAALELEGTARRLYLDKSCAGDPELRQEVESLLDQESQSVTVISDAISGASVELAAAHAPAILPGSRIGSYRIISELGKGGMGTVYLAERADAEYDKKVAIKVVQRGMVSDQVLARFRRERRSVRSNGIRRSETILDYCATHKPSIADRLRLFQSVCIAVHHGREHRRGQAARLRISEAARHRAGDGRRRIMRVLNRSEEIQSRLLPIFIRLARFSMNC